MTIESIQTVEKIERYKGLVIYRDENGFFAENGYDALGYTETVDELKVEIDDYFNGTEFGEANGFFAGDVA